MGGCATLPSFAFFIESSRIVRFSYNYGESTIYTGFLVVRRTCGKKTFFTTFFKHFL